MVRQPTAFRLGKRRSTRPGRNRRDHRATQVTRVRDAGGKIWRGVSTWWCDCNGRKVPHSDSNVINGVREESLQKFFPILCVIHTRTYVMAFARSHQTPGAKSSRTEELRDQASVVNYPRSLNSSLDLNSSLEANQIREDTLNNNSDRKAKKRKLNQKKTSMGIQTQRRSPEYPASFIHPTTFNCDLLGSEEPTSPVLKKFRLDDGASQPLPTDHPDLLPIPFPTGLPLTMLYNFYAKILLQVQHHQHQIYQQRKALDHFLANQSKVDCSKESKMQLNSEVRGGMIQNSSKDGGILALQGCFTRDPHTFLAVCNA